MHSNLYLLATLAVLSGASAQSAPLPYLGTTAKNTATGTAAIEAARATAKTLSPTSNVKGKTFDRFVTVWLENTDFDMAAGDRESSSTISRAYSNTE